MYKYTLDKIQQELKKLTTKVNCGVQFFDTFSEFPEEGRGCALYVDKSTGDIYVWSGTEYIINNASGGGGGEYYRCGLTVDELDLTFISNQISTLGSYTIPTLYIGDELSYQTGDEIRIILFNGEYLTGIIGSYDSVTGQATSILVTGVFGTSEDFLDCVNLESAYSTGFVPYIGAGQDVDLGGNSLDAYSTNTTSVITTYLTTDTITANALPAATTDTDAFIVKESGQLATRTGSQVLSDIGGVGGTGTAGQVAYWSGTSAVTGSSNLFWDAANNRLGIGTNAPTVGLTTSNKSVYILGENSTTALVVRPNASVSSSFNTFEVQGTTGTVQFSVNRNGPVSSSGAITVGGNTIYGPVDITLKNSGGTTLGIIQQTSIFSGSATYGFTSSLSRAFTFSHGIESSGQSTFRGSGTTSATTALLVQNSTPTNLLTVRDDGRIQQIIPGMSGATIFGKNAGDSASLNGSNNSFFGEFSGRDTTTGGSNSFFGRSSGLFNTVGNQNSLFGTNAGSGVSTGDNNSFFGYFAGRHLSDGSTLLTSISNSVFIGSDTRANNQSQTNQIAIGYQATGLGSNTTVIGNSSTIQTHLYGSLTVGDTTLHASAVVDISSTTKGFLPPRMTTVERDLIATPAAGLVIFNTTTTKLETYNGTSWQSGTILITTTGTLTTAGWSLVSGLYEQSISDANITASSLVDIIPNNADIDIVTAAQILPRTDSAAGSVKVYAKNLPTANIGVTLNIWK